MGAWVSVGGTSPTVLLMEEVGQQLCRTPSTTSRSFTSGFFLICVECGSFHSIGAEVEGSFDSVPTANYRSILFVYFEIGLIYAAQAGLELASASEVVCTTTPGSHLWQFERKYP